MEALPPAPVNPEWRAIVGRVLTVWSGYQLGVEQQAGGDETSEKHVWFGDVLADHVANSRGLNADGLEEWITSLLYQDFDLVLEDDSTYPTAHLLLEAHGYWKAGDRTRLTQLMGTLPSEERVREARRASRRGADQEEEEGDEGEPVEEEDERAGSDDDDREDKPKRDRQPRTVTDDDGWTTGSHRWWIDNLCSSVGHSPPSPHTMQCDEMRASLVLVTKEAHGLWEENKDLQGRFVNDLGELHRIQLAIGQLETDQRHDQLAQARQSLADMQRRASSLYDMLQEKRSQLVKKLGDGLQHVALLQNNLISERLLEWKNRQKLFQIGIPFENREQSLDDLQCDFELLAEHNWQMRTFASWQIDLLRRGPQLTDNNAQAHINNLSTILDQLTKLLCMLVSQSFIVSVQPEPVLKTQHKFVTEARLLIGDKLGIRQHLVHTNVTVRIIAEEEARLLSIGQMGYPDVKTVGTISNEYEKINMDERGHMVCKFNNSKLTRIAHRKPPPKGSMDMKTMGVASPGPNMLMTSQAATDQKYALLYNISSFQLGNLGKFDVWTLSLPLMVTVHGSQDCDAQGAILWQRAFANVNRCGTGNELVLASWPDLAQVIRHKFSLFTGAKRHLSDTDLSYLYEKLYAPGSQEGKPITFHQFAKQDLRDDVGFTFWEWLFSCMQLIKQKLLKFWDEGWLIGFISKHDASSQLLQMPHSSFLLRFSDTQTGAVSICFALEDDNKKIPFHLAPFTIKDLDQLSLAQRIITCPQLKEIRYLYPSIDKEEMLKYFESEERQKAEQESTTGYIMSEIVMVAKTAKQHRGSSFAADSPSPLSNQSKLDWSPGEVLPGGANNNSMDVGDELVSMLNNSGLMENGDVEALLGPGFRPQLPSQPLQQIDLSFVDQFGQPVMGMQPPFYNGQ